jgi:hypothetical protein
MTWGDPVADGASTYGVQFFQLFFRQLRLAVFLMHASTGGPTASNASPARPDASPYPRLQYE